MRYKGDRQTLRPDEEERYLLTDRQNKILNKAVEDLMEKSGLEIVPSFAVIEGETVLNWGGDAESSTFAHAGYRRNRIWLSAR